MFDKITLVGLGLIGSSLGHAIKRGSLAKEITGFDASADVCARAAKLGFTDTIAPSAEAAVQDADLVILCTPVGAYKAVAQAIAPHLKAGAVLSDVGSVKGAVVRDVGRRCRQGCISFPPIPSPARNFPAPKPVSPACLMGAGPS